MAHSIWRATNGETLVAGALSLLLPGSGHIYQGRQKVGLVLATIFATLVVLTNAFDITHSYSGYLRVNWAITIFTLITVIHCVYFKDRANKTTNPKWLVGSFGILAFGSALYIYQLSAFASGTRTFVVPSSSMEPTVNVGEAIVVDMKYYKSHTANRGDIVILQAKDVPHSLRRIIALGGDSIEIRETIVYVNGSRIDEPFVKHRSRADDYGVHWINNFGPITVPDHFLFAMGDNRPVSFDSRAPEVGPIPVKNLEGRPLYIVRSRDDARLGTTLN